MQGPGNQSRTNVAPKTNIDTCSCGSSWYCKKGTNVYLQQIPGKAKSNRYPENCTNKGSTYSEKSNVNLTKFMWSISIKLIPIIYLQLLFIYISICCYIYVMYTHTHTHRHKKNPKFNVCDCCGT